MVSKIALITADERKELKDVLFDFVKKVSLGHHYEIPGEAFLILPEIACILIGTKEVEIKNGKEVLKGRGKAHGVLFQTPSIADYKESLI